MARKTRRRFRKKFRIKAKTKKKIAKNSKIVIIVSCILLGLYICVDNNYEYETITREDVKIEEEKFQFIKQIEKGAKISYEKYGVLPSITVAQAILESGWGQSELTKDSNNLFGIKADDSWDGKVTEVITTENYSDKVVAKFRKYNSLQDSIKDHAKFLKENKRYEEGGLFLSDDYKEQAQSLENAGYSTKKNESGESIYADMLVDLIERYKLNLMD
ncbi:glycoside hydrolase family 73 protein [Clostridium sp.]|uniref:glycoside hydrolase family 73 protein n=1 Tax=Clostridium sp. TaxID=1506 RepID=UPI002FC88553